MLESEAARRVSLTRFVSHVNSHWHHDSCVQPSRKRDKEFMKHKHSGYVLLSGGRFPPFHPPPYVLAIFVRLVLAQPALNI